MSFTPAMRVLVTAGASGIGKAIADTFHQQGARVRVCDISEAHTAEFKSQYPDIECTICDVADSGQVTELFESVRQNWDGLDVLVNNAGIAGPTAPVERVELEEWNRTLAVNITAQFLCVREAVPMLKQAGGGAIINLSSVAGRLGFPLRTPYASSKWAVVGFTKSLAAELGPDNIRVNAILPGAVAGDRIESVIRAKASAREVSYEQMREQFLQQNSLRQFVGADEIAQMALYLASDTGRAISGQAVSVCGNIEHLV